jgi:hypothetical protein
VLAFFDRPAPYAEILTEIPITAGGTRSFQTWCAR